MKLDFKELEQALLDYKAKSEYKQAAIIMVRNIFKEAKAEQLIITDVSKSLNADELINSLGTPDVYNEYIVKPDMDGTWWIEHKHVGSGEPLKQWLTGKP